MVAYIKGKVLSIFKLATKVCIFKGVRWTNYQLHFKYDIEFIK